MSDLVGNPKDRFSLDMAYMFIYFVYRDQGLHYLSFRFWVGLWTGIILLIMVAFDLSALVRYITRFTEESFAALIAAIFIKEAFAKLIDITKKHSVNLNGDVSPFHDCICFAPPPTNTTADNTTLANTTSLFNQTTMSTVKVTSALTTNMSYDNMTTTLGPTKAWHMIARADCEAEGGVLVGEGCPHVADVFFFSCLLFLGTFTLAYTLKAMKTRRFFPTKVGM